MNEKNEVYELVFISFLTVAVIKHLNKSNFKGKMVVQVIITYHYLYDNVSFRLIFESANIISIFVQFYK